MKTRTQINVMVAFMDDMYYIDGDKRPHLDIKYSHLFPMSENHVFRNMNYIKSTIVEDEAGEEKVIHFGKFLVLRNDRRQVDISADTRPLDMLEFGVVLHFVRDENGNSLEDIFGVSEMEYKRALRSASQFRTAKLLATESSLVDDVRNHASYGWIKRIEGSEFKTVAKVEPYIGLALSSSVSAGTGYTDVNIKDYESTVDITGALTMDNKSGINEIIRYDEVKGNTDSMELTDGQAMIAPKAMVKAAYESGIIFKSEYKKLKGAFIQGIAFKNQLTDEILAPIWKKIPRGIQFRYGLKKGFAIVVDHDYTYIDGTQFDFVFPDGANKGEVKRFENIYADDVYATAKKYEDKGLKVAFKGKNVVVVDNGSGATDEEVELCIANVATTKEKYWGLLNYQFITSLTLDFTNDIQPLATKAISEIMKALQSPEDAMAFIGMIDNGDEEAYAEQNAVQKIREILGANPRIFYTKWMQSKIKQLMTKSMEDMRRGRIPLEDSRFVFIVTDPSTLMKDGKPLLKKGESYYNGQTGKRAIFRSPLIHKSETVVINLVNRPELEEAFGHLNNVLILNAFDDTLPRMGGADTDGDKVLLVNEPIIIDAVERNQPMVYGDVDTQELEPIKWENGGWKHIFEYDKNTLVPSQIGTITNYCTAIADKARDIRTHENAVDSHWELVTLGRILQGKIIDDAKRGTTTQIDNRLRVKIYPEWLEAGKERYESYSPMGRLYRWITKIVMPAFKDKFSEVKGWRENILIDFKDYNPAELNRILPEIASLEETYRHNVATFFTENGDEPNKEDFESIEEYKELMEQRSSAFVELIERHQRLLANVDASTSTIGMACIHVAENLQRTGANKIASYPFVVATEYVKALLAGLPSNFKLMRAYDVDGGLWTTSVEVVNNVVYNKEGEEIAHVKNVVDGEYETHTFKGSYFLKVEQEVEVVEVERAKEEDKLVHFELSGFKHCLGKSTTPEDVMKLINKETLAIQRIVNENGKWLGIMFKGKQIGAVGKETFLNASFAEGKEINVVDLQPIKGIVKVTATIGAKVEEEITTHSEVAPPKESTINVQQIDMFDASIGM
jgi:hypothetical protein